MSPLASTEPLDILKLEHFQPALATDFSGRGPQRAFGTLLAPRVAGEGDGTQPCVRRVLTPNGDTYALKLLKVDSGQGNGSRFGVPSLSLAAEREARERLRMAHEKAFLEEYRCHLAVSHLKGFPKVHGIGMVGETPALLMEWVEGTPLGQMEERFAGDAESIARLGVAVLDVLLGTRSLDAPFVHRDLSPWNVIVSLPEEGADGSVPTVTLVDFGSSSLASEQDPTFTMSFDIWRGGTPEYAAPEMLTQDIPGIAQLRTSPTIDTYALCSMLFELLCGQTPFMVALRPGASVYRIKMDEQPKRLDLGSLRDNNLEDLLLRGIAADQALRYDVSEMHEALSGWLDRRQG